MEKENQLSTWDEFYENTKEVHFDEWLSKHEAYFVENQNGKIIELGAGNGGNSNYLFNKGYDIIASDYSKEAISNIKRLNERIQTLFLDIRNPLPFIDNYFSIIIADLSLHYFNMETTLKIIREIYRIIKNGGYVMIRVNSTKDINFGAGKGILIEENYYNDNGNYKRFFDINTINKVFDEIRWEKISIDEYGILKYKNEEKIVWEIINRAK